MRGTNGRNLSTSLLPTATTNSAIANVERFYWDSILRSVVRNTSNSAAARRSNSPFLMPAHPMSATVRTSWPTMSERSWRGTHSSSSTRTTHHDGARLFQHGDGPFPAYGWEVVQKRVEGMLALKVVEQRLDRHMRANEDERTAEEFGITVNNRVSRRQAKHPHG